MSLSRVSRAVLVRAQCVRGCYYVLPPSERAGYGSVAGDADLKQAPGILGKLLVANRGEIACRVLETARKMGIPTVAVYSEADAAGMHVRKAHEGVCIGPPPSQSSYLRADKILEVARKLGVGAIHPGYGFLSENSDFARACKENGIQFVGPPEEAIASMGSKKEAKEIMSAAGVPVVPGYHGEDQDIERLQVEADMIGYPLLVKAIMGGGGKGMKLARSACEVKEAIESAKREAASSFGDPRVLLERFIEHPRHIEVQIMADQHGNVVHLFERDCSIQRRHQKVIEEAPAPGISDAFRKKIGAAAVAAARAVGYTSAGTVEFIVDTRTDEFFFMEMNTRLQVEHPITEFINAVDLVEMQLRVASGEILPFAQEDLEIKGHAIEARLYAENPAKDFLPASGKLARWKIPSNAGRFSLENVVRIDSGVEEGDEIGISYDPMIAKVIAHGKNREEAIHRLADALSNLQVAGFPTNTDFVAQILQLPAFQHAHLDTNFITDNKDAIEALQSNLPWQVVALAAMSRLLTDQSRQSLCDTNSKKTKKPWYRSCSKRLNGVVAQHTFDLLHPPSGEYQKIIARICDGNITLSGYASDDLSEELWSCPVRGASLQGIQLALELGTERAVADVLWLKSSGSETSDHTADVWWNKKHFQLVEPRKKYIFGDESGNADEAAILSPMPGKVLRVDVADGQFVHAGDIIVVVEAMKMEHALRAAFSGVVSQLNCAPGAQVQDGHVMARIEAVPAPGAK